MVDDAHSSGVLGRNGRGTVDHFNLHGRVDIQVGTLSKAIGVLGGYVCGTRDLIEFLYHRGAAVPVLHVASAVGRGHLHRGLRRSGAGARAHRQALGEHALLEEGAGRTGLQHRRREHAGQRNADHADHHRRRQADHGLLARAVQRGRDGNRHRVPDRSGRQGAHPHDRDGNPHKRRTRPGAGDLEARRQAHGHRLGSG